MGVSVYTYIGVYLRIYPIEKNGFSVTKKCPNHSNIFHKNCNFCNKCGAKLYDESKPIKSYELPNYDLFDMDKFYIPHAGGSELMEHKLGCIILPQVGKFNRNNDTYGLCEVPLAGNVIDQDIDKFKEQFDDEIRLLKEGGWEFEILWGVVQHAA